MNSDCQMGDGWQESDAAMGLQFETPATCSPTFPSIFGTWHRELWWFLALVLIANLHLIGIPTAEPLIFLSDKVAAGEWWRVLTHPFVHVSLYQLGLDAGAFFVCYMSIREPHQARRLAAMLLFGIGGLIGAYTLGVAKTAYGFCGLSGIAHGIMAWSMLELISSKSDRASRVLGSAFFAVLIVKSVYETLTGIPFLDFLHFGPIGVPLLGSHLGGVITGVLVWAIFTMRNRDR